MSRIIWDNKKIAAILAIIDPNLPIHIYTDASIQGIEAVLKQPQRNGEENPCAYFSRKLNDTQKRKKAIPGVEWILVHRHFTYKSKNPRILAPLIVIPMTPDNNKVHFLTSVTNLLIPQRMNSFNKEEQVNFVKWYYSGLLSFRHLSGATSSKSDMLNIIQCHLWLSPRLHFPAITILTNSLILSIIVHFRKR
jgi:hypothetical protein